MKKNFAGQEFESGGKKVKVKDVVIWHKNGKIVIALDLLGTVNGKILNWLSSVMTKQKKYILTS
jgi:hypothetical protein